jgi:hypothetical protein
MGKQKQKQIDEDREKRLEREMMERNKVLLA